MVLCKQVQEGIVVSENQRYIRRNLELICDNLLDVLHSSPSQEAKQQVIKCLSRIGYIVEQDFKRYVKYNMKYIYTNKYFLFLDHLKVYFNIKT
jgi:hypothetical protein